MGHIPAFIKARKNGRLMGELMLEWLVYEFLNMSLVDSSHKILFVSPLTSGLLSSAERELGAQCL